MKKYHKLYKENSGTNCILVFENQYENNEYCVLIGENEAPNPKMKRGKINIHRLRANYKSISERKARNIHPALFESIS